MVLFAHCRKQYPLPSCTSTELDSRFFQQPQLSDSSPLPQTIIGHWSDAMKTFRASYQRMNEKKAMESPKLGDMYRCNKCELKIHFTKGCDCKECSTELKCCGQPLDKVTEPAVQNR
jgi:hypothetical protein